MTNEKQILYNVIRREVSNLTAGNAFLRMFDSYISDYIISYIDPYVNAFMSNGKIDDKATAYLKQETLAKIEEFKNKFDEEKQNEENK